MVRQAWNSTALLNKQGSVGEYEVQWQCVVWIEPDGEIHNFFAIAI